MEWRDRVEAVKCPITQANTIVAPFASIVVNSLLFSPEASPSLQSLHKSFFG
jgi:hypothetical protein